MLPVITTSPFRSDLPRDATALAIHIIGSTGCPLTSSPLAVPADCPFNLSSQTDPGISRSRQFSTVSPITTPAPLMLVAMDCGILASPREGLPSIISKASAICATDP